MRTLDKQNTVSFTWRARMARNLRLLVRIGSMVKAYFTTGAAIRKRYREKMNRGGIYYVDAE